MNIPSAVKTGIRNIGVLMALFLVTAWTSADATVLVFDDALNIIGHYARGPSSISQFIPSPSTITSGAAELTSAGSALVPTSTGLVTVPTSLAVDIAAPEVATMAGAAFEALSGPVGAAYTGYQLYQLLKTTNLIGCPGSFFCMSDPSQPVVYPGTWSYPYGPNTTDVVSVCNAYVAARTPAITAGSAHIVPSGVDLQCHGTMSGADVALFSFAPVSSGTCPTGYTLQGSSCVTTSTVPADANAVSSAVAASEASDPSFASKVVKALQSDANNNPSTAPPFSSLVPSDATVTASAAPVTGPATVVNVQSVQNPDGTTSTITTTDQNTVTPVSSGNTPSTFSETYNVQDTSTVVNHNNTTNVTTTTTNVTNIAAPPPSVAPGAPASNIQFPTDYARQNTLQSTLTELQAAAAPTMADQGAIVSSAKTSSDLTSVYSGATSGYSSSQSSWFSWVWSPPVSTCAPFTGTVHGFPISLDLCPTIADIRTVLAWLCALFGSYQVYSQLFKRGSAA